MPSFYSAILHIVSIHSYILSLPVCKVSWGLVENSWSYSQFGKTCWQSKCCTCPFGTVIQSLGQPSIL